VVLIIDYKLFRRGVRRVVAKSIKYAVPWREYVLDWGGMVRELECTVEYIDAKKTVDTVCREVGRAREYTLKPIITIKNDNEVVTVLVGD
jgi:hypothetical protein